MITISAPATSNKKKKINKSIDKRKFHFPSKVVFSFLLLLLYYCYYIALQRRMCRRRGGHGKKFFAAFFFFVQMNPTDIITFLSQQNIHPPHARKVLISPIVQSKL
jgi:hypothetical protein